MVTLEGSDLMKCTFWCNEEHRESRRFHHEERAESGNHIASKRFMFPFPQQEGNHSTIPIKYLKENLL